MAEPVQGCQWQQKFGSLKLSFEYQGGFYMDHRISRVAMRVRGYHLDGYGHVNNARYLEFLEEGRWGYFDDRPALARRLTRGDVAFVAVNLNIDYREAAVAGDDLEVRTRRSALGARSA